MGQHRYRHLDFRGNVKFVSDQGGEIRSHYQYDAYGLRQLRGSDDDPVRFAGRSQIGELMALGARIYDPAVGRFLSPDPVLQHVNQYAYTLGNPVWFADPSGRDFESVLEGILATGGLAAATAGLFFVASPGMRRAGGGLHDAGRTQLRHLGGSPGQRGGGGPHRSRLRGSRPDGSGRRTAGIRGQPELLAGTPGFGAGPREAALDPDRGAASARSSADPLLVRAQAEAIPMSGGRRRFRARGRGRAGLDGDPASSALYNPIATCAVAAVLSLAFRSSGGVVRSGRTAAATRCTWSAVSTPRRSGRERSSESSPPLSSTCTSTTSSFNLAGLLALRRGAGGAGRAREIPAGGRSLDALRVDGRPRPPAGGGRGGGGFGRALRNGRGDGRLWCCASGRLRRPCCAGRAGFSPSLLAADAALALLAPERVGWTVHLGGLVGGMAAMALLSRGGGPIPLGRSSRSDAAGRSRPGGALPLGGRRRPATRRLRPHLRGDRAATT